MWTGGRENVHYLAEYQSNIIRARNMQQHPGQGSKNTDIWSVGWKCRVTLWPWFQKSRCALTSQVLLKDVKTLRPVPRKSFWSHSYTYIYIYTYIMYMLFVMSSMYVLYIYVYYAYHGYIRILHIIHICVTLSMLGVTLGRRQNCYESLSPLCWQQGRRQKLRDRPNLQTEVPIPIQYQSILHELSRQWIVLGT